MAKQKQPARSSGGNTFFGGAAILAVGKIAKTPVVVTDEEGEDAIVIKSMCALCLSYDHRIIDGAEAAKFLQKVKNYLQNPVLLI